MTTSLILACLWVLLAGAAMMMPRRYHWRAAAVLIALGLPLLVYVFVQNGVWIGLIALAGAVSVLRWPVFRLLQRLGVLRGSAG
jgi:hypothetical protein